MAFCQLRLLGIWALSVFLSGSGGPLLAAEAKLQTGPLRISGVKRENHWKYVSKFGYAVGSGTYNIKVQVKQPKTLAQDTKLEFSVYLDEDWAQVDATEDPCGRLAHARQKREIVLKKDGNWSETVFGSLSQSVRPHIWYFALSDCSGALQNFTHRLKFEFHAQQAGGSEFSIEQSGMLSLNVFFFLGFCAFIYIFYQRTRKFSESAGSIHPVIWTLTIAMVAQFIAQAFHVIHLWRYQSDGQGVKALEVLSEILMMIAQVTQTSLLILIGLGYTLLQSKIGELDLMIPMSFMVGVVHIMLVGFGKIKDDAAYKYHENEGAVGWILLVIRLLLYAWFLWAVNSSANEGSAGIKRFLGQFRMVGSGYFLGYPVVFLVTKAFAPYWQHGVMATGLLSMQMGSNIWLSSMFLSRGDYFKVSTLSASDLPGGTKAGMVKEE